MVGNGKDVDNFRPISKTEFAGVEYILQDSGILLFPKLSGSFVFTNKSS